MNERQWMRHGIRLLEDRIKRFDPRHEMVRDPFKLLKRFEWELAWREHVMALTVQGRAAELSPLGQVWFEYMRDHARAQVARYGGELNELEFRVVCRGLRSARDERIKGILYARKKVG